MYFSKFAGLLLTPESICVLVYQHNDGDGFLFSVLTNRKLTLTSRKLSLSVFQVCHCAASAKDQQTDSHHQRMQEALHRRGLLA